VEIHIAKDGEAIRILGLWQGNGISTKTKWNEIVERQAKTMKLWGFLYPSIAGRILVVRALVISLACILPHGGERHPLGHLVGYGKEHPLLHME